MPQALTLIIGEAQLTIATSITKPAIKSSRWPEVGTFHYRKFDFHLISSLLHFAPQSARR